MTASPGGPADLAASDDDDDHHRRHDDDDGDDDYKNEKKCRENCDLKLLRAYECVYHRCLHDQTLECVDNDKLGPIDDDGATERKKCFGLKH